MQDEVRQEFFHASFQSPDLHTQGSGTVEHWYAIHTRARHERLVEQRLRERGLTTFLPLMTEVHRWSDRRQTVEVPFFSCYLFARLAPTNHDRMRVLRVEGVLRLVGSQPEGTPVPDEQVRAVRVIIEKRLPWSSYPFLKLGQRVRIRSGAMDGLEGILVSRNGDRILVVSVDALQRSLAIRLEGYELEAA